MEQPESIHMVANFYGLSQAGPARMRTYAERYKELADSHYGKRVATIDEVISTSVVPGEMAHQLDDIYEEGDAIALLMGDGSLQAFTTDIAKYSENPALSRAPLLVLDGGFACDVALQLHTRKQLQRPSTILDSGQTIDFSPMAWTFRNEEGEQTYLANAYGTVGLSALMALVINRPEVRRGTGDNMAKKIWACLPEARQAKVFPVEFLDEGKERTVYEMGLANGSRMGGNGGVFPVRLEQPKLYGYEINTPGYAATALKAATHRLGGTLVDGPVHFRLPEPTPVQLEGEARVWEPGTEVTVAQAPAWFTVYGNSPQ